MGVWQACKYRSSVSFINGDPSWNVLLMQYRTAKNYMSTAYLGPRTLDKLIFSFLIFR